jgi:HSP20 family molecular chaperone IbpA
MAWVGNMNGQRRQSWMWAEACALLDQAERRHRHFFDLLNAPSAAPAWEPPANIFSLGGELHVSVAIPGARAEDVRVQILASGLLIETTVAPPSLAAGMNVVRLEIPYGRMRRRIDLPPGRYRLLEHRLEHGYLFLRLARSNL